MKNHGEKAKRDIGKRIVIRVFRKTTFCDDVLGIFGIQGTGIQEQNGTLLKTLHMCHSRLSRSIRSFYAGLYFSTRFNLKLILKILDNPHALRYISYSNETGFGMPRNPWDLETQSRLCVAMMGQKNSTFLLNRAPD